MSKQYIKDIKIRGFRNIDAAELTFSDGINIIYGENAQGKTNLVEAIWLLSGGKSFRGSKDREMIGFDRDSFRIEGNVTNGERDINITVACSKTNPKFSSRMGKTDRKDFDRASLIAGSFYCVIFSPVHLNIISGGPVLRRKFADACLCQLNLPFIDRYRRYNRALATRNAFLKNIKKYDDIRQESIFNSLDDALCQNGYYIYKQRKRFCDTVGERAAEYYKNISGDREKLTVVYKNRADSRESMKNGLLNSREKDIYTGSTNFGVHREDIEFYLDGKPAKDYASQGQQRSIVIALKLAESDMMENFTEISPVILLDDVLSELDFQRQDYLLNNIRGKQVFITTCECERIRLSDSKKIYVENGRIKEICM
ncbi:MAG: DNA replication/repair protein RecF [Oscillospiraceae bacterium]|nr:DNA replication/repair protein RecF [Oscillospiraceae bacterium]